MADFSQASEAVQHGRGVKGHFVYWITQSAPTPDVEQLEVRSPSEFTRAKFRSLVVEAHAGCGEDVVNSGRVASGWK